ncbi:hypothetical protein SPRG_10639 [Saprolegnia parasitica CBS 223.65]|uniref:Uncharacterized protein n=1 Tax=Saprolegnia parasitica (strain CBS 223.65) TaxID=695850 RepID=A0A067C526_SAPPC|nr:hypothetical protein SPRG_10639 [Saprolegnia parasitica CBS 223.65]KDO24210.1 hypothetical protein SPRG_10639 [Saprolegnia parasitica CBS 223.65]|eukprot:XP_012205154.1 hypothetical protein SPRG_10639 [Saprolegnia parasitica CBS 223.65]
MHRAQDRAPGGLPFATTGGNSAIKQFFGVSKINFVDFLEREQRSTLSPASLKSIPGRNWIHLSNLVVVNLWWYKNGCHLRLVERIAARELTRPDSNAFQQRVFSFCKLIDSPLRQNLGNTKFEMLLVLAFNKRTLSAECELVKVLEATMTALESATTPIDLNGNIDNDETEAGFIVVETLRSAATVGTASKEHKISSDQFELVSIQSLG